jgi:hypothetical protein
MGILDWLISDERTPSPSELAAEAESIRQREAELNRRRLEIGYWDQDDYERAEARETAEYQNVQVDIASVTGEFAPTKLAANLGESASKAGKAVGSVVGNVVQAAGNFVGNTLLGFPIWFWLIVGAAAFFYLGGGNIIRAKVARAAS